MMIIIHIQNKWEETFLFWMRKHESWIQEREKRMEKEKISPLPNHARTTMDVPPHWKCPHSTMRETWRSSIFETQRRSNMPLEHNPPTHTQWHVFFKCWLFIFLIISCTSKKTKLILIHIDYYSKIKGKKSKKYDRLKIIVLENWK